VLLRNVPELGLWPRDCFIFKVLQELVEGGSRELRPYNRAQDQASPRLLTAPAAALLHAASIVLQKK